MNSSLFLFTGALLALAAFTSEDTPSNARWLTDLDEASRVAGESGRPLLAAFR